MVLGSESRVRARSLILNILSVEQIIVVTDSLSNYYDLSVEQIIVVTE